MIRRGGAAKQPETQSTGSRPSVGDRVRARGKGAFTCEPTRCRVVLNRLPDARLIIRRAGAYSGFFQLEGWGLILFRKWGSGGSVTYSSGAF